MRLSALRRWFVFLVVAAQVAGGAFVVFAQTPGLRLRFSTEGREERPHAPLGEFRVSLDSQVLAPAPTPAPDPEFGLAANEFGSPPSFRDVAEPFVLHTRPWPLNDFPVSDRADGDRRVHVISSTLTWKAPYLDVMPPAGGPPWAGGVLPENPERTGLGIGHRHGRWAIYGEFSRRGVPQLPTAAPAPSYPTEIAQSPSSPPKASLRVSDPDDSGASSRQAGVLAPDLPGAPTSLGSFLADTYSLEAIYRFLPTVFGRVSYNRSVVETLAPDQKIQVEGIVETSQDTLIRAGYRNEHVHERENQRPANDTKVWTEFILKF